MIDTGRPTPFGRLFSFALRCGGLSVRLVVTREPPPRPAAIPAGSVRRLSGALVRQWPAETAIPLQVE